MRRNRKSSGTAGIIIAIMLIIGLIASLPKELIIALISTSIILPIIIIIIKSPTIKGFIGELIVSLAISKTSTENKVQYIINNIILKDETGKTSQIDHIIINQNGVYVIETKNYKGTIYGDEWNFNWIQELNNGNQYEFYSPIRQNQTHMNMVLNAIQMQVPIYSIIIFVRGNIDNVNSNKVYKLKSFVEKEKSNERKRISIETVDEIYSILIDYKNNPRATIKEHIDNITQ